jgi:hypothetical protein
MKTSVTNCPLCLNSETENYSKDPSRSYYLCPFCQLVFVARDELISFDKELERYQAHENDPSDDGYSKYLEKIVTDIHPHLKPSGQGLDFGCGRTTLLADHLKHLGYEMDSYDTYFLKDELIWDKTYDFIILSEVIEHLRMPRQDMRQLGRHLNPQGKIFIKTKFMRETKAEFDNWFYKRDSTHIQFFNPGSMEYLKNFLGLTNFKTIGTDLYCID